MEATPANRDAEEERTAAPTGPADGASSPNKPKLRWLWILLSVAVLGIVVVGLGYLEDTADVSRNEAPPPLPPVSVEHVPVGPQQVVVRSFAEIRPRWSAELSASVAGRIEKVFAAALAGEPVDAGTKLIEIENTRYAAELAAAELAHKEARLAHWQAKNATLLAREEFKRNNSSPPNDLALKLPQLEIAESAVASTRARLEAARKQLDDTIITAPFAAYVTERFVSPGQSVVPGDRFVKLVDQSSFELVAEIGRKDWQLLKLPLEGQAARLLDQDGREIANATVRRGGGFLDERTRQYRIFLEAEEAVLSGDFVTLLLDGVAVDRALDIPSSGLTREGFVWIVNDDDELRRIEPEILFRRHDRVIVRAPSGDTGWRVAVTPLASFLPGQKVVPQVSRD